MFPRFFLIFSTIITFVRCYEDDEASCTDIWAVTIPEELNPYNVANNLDMINYQEILPNSNIYEFRLKSKMDTTCINNTGYDPLILQNYSKIIQVERQYRKKRIFKGKYVPDLISTNDPLWSRSWHLRKAIGRPEMKIQEAWALGFNGRGVRVTHLDDGLDFDHPDLFHNYSPDTSYDFIDGDTDPKPVYNTSIHGTNMAGIVAAQGNNSFCGVGIAFNAKLGMIRILQEGKRVSDIEEAKAWSYKRDKIDIYVVGYGPNDEGIILDGPGNILSQAIRESAIHGRNGKGNIILYPPGNGGNAGDSCAFDGYANDIHTIPLNAVGEYGTRPYYAENCTAIMASTFSSGINNDRYMVTTTINGECSTKFSGTSSSTAVGGGVMALLLQSNPNLTWRDVQHLIVRSVRPRIELPSDSNWRMNGVGRYYSDLFGYGLIDVQKLVQNGLKWIKVPKQLHFSTTKVVPKGKTLFIEKDVPRTWKSGIADQDTKIRYLEHVQVTFSAITPRRGDVTLVLISPSGTRSDIMKGRQFDLYQSGFQNWTVLSVQFWEENPVGVWELEIGHNGYSDQPYIFTEWSLKIFGTREHPEPDKRHSTTTTLKSTTTTTPINSSGKLDSIISSIIKKVIQYSSIIFSIFKIK